MAHSRSKPKSAAKAKTKARAKPKVDTAAKAKPKRKSRLTRRELTQFKKVLLALRERVVGNVSYMEDQALRNPRQEGTGELSSVPMHMADVGTDNFEQELMIELIESGEAELRDIDLAIDSIEEGTYGICEECSKAIPKARLAALPYARLCVACKSKQERGQG